MGRERGRGRERKRKERERGRERGVLLYLATVDTPSTNLVLKSTLALLNMPSFRDTTMN